MLSAVGVKYKTEKQFTSDIVEAFANLTGDNNPIHLDEEYAASTQFGRPIVHGFLVGSLFSQIFGTQFPGKGAIYLSQEVKFMAPVYVGDLVVSEVEVVSVQSRRITFNCNAYVKGSVVMEGKAELLKRKD